MNKVTSTLAKKSLSQPSAGAKKTTQFKIKLSHGKAFCGKLCMPLRN